MASNLDLNVIISASIEKLKRGMTDAVNVVKGSTKKIQEGTGQAKKSIEDMLASENLRVKRRIFSQNINEAKAAIQGLETELKDLSAQLANTGKFDFRAQAKLKGQITATKQQLAELNGELLQNKANFSQANLAIQDGSQKAEQNTQAMEALSRAVNAAAMATLLMAGDNKELGQVMRGVQVTMALASAGVAVYNLVQRQNEIWTLAAAKAQAVFTWAVGASTVAMKAFRVALIASGVGAAILLVAALAGAFDDTTEAVDELDKKLEENKKTLESSARFAGIYTDYLGQKAIADLKRRGATDREVFDQEQRNLKTRIRLLKQEADAKHKMNEDVRDMRAEIYKLELEYEANITQFADEQIEKRKTKYNEYLDWLRKWAKEKAAIEKKMEENLTQFLVDEEVKRVKERGKAREMTEADLMPAGAPAVTTGLVGAPGEGPFDPVAESADNAGDAVVNFANNFRAATKRLAIDMQTNAIKAQQWALSLESISESANAMLDSLKTEAIVGFAEMLGKAAVGELSAAQDFFQGFAQALANFLDQFGKLLVAEGVAIQAADIALKTGNGIAAIAAGGALVAAAAAMKAHQAKGIPAFADGGIVSGPTLGLMGEYPGARSNPEVIAPLDKLQSMINTGGGGNFVASTKFDGRDLWLAVNRYDKDRARG